MKIISTFRQHPPVIPPKISVSTSQMSRAHAISAMMACFCLSISTLCLGRDAANDEFFEGKVRPILVAKCSKCHGDNAKAIKGGLRLTSREAVLKGGDTGPAAVPGKPAESSLIAAIHYDDEPRMPPKGKLSDAEISILTTWVERGLPWPASPPSSGPVKAPWRITEEQRKHWSFQPVRTISPPSVKDIGWPKSDLDRWILAGLESKGLRPATVADKRTLIRRASFDLIGLPPTPAEVDQFLNDSSPDAFAKLVDRLLASPRYGERWGRHWLDLVRYADSRDARGIGSADDITEAWRYRDWVVSAFNRDLPYDRFVIDQIAGDLIPPIDPKAFNAEGMVATGLLTIGEWGTGDADKEKMMTDIVADQVDVVSRAFMGLTVACARCHDHKFDPISHADYYGLAGIFFSTHILPEPGAKTAGSPMLKTPIVPQSKIAAVSQYKVELARLEAEQKVAVEAESAAVAIGQIGRTTDYLRAAAEFARSTSSPRTLDVIAKERNLNPIVLSRWLAVLGLSNEGTLLTIPQKDMGGAKSVDYWTTRTGKPWIGVNSQTQPVSLLTYILPPRSVNLHPGPAESAGISWTSPIKSRIKVTGRVVDSDSACGNGVSWIVERRQGLAWKTIASGEIENGGKNSFQVPPLPIEVGDAIRLVVSSKQEYSCDTTTIDLTISPEHGPAWNLADDVLPDILLVDKGNPHPDRSGRPDVWRFLMLDSTKTTLQNTPNSPLNKWHRALETGDSKDLEAAGQAIQKLIAAETDSKPSSDLTLMRRIYYPASVELPAEAIARLAKRQSQIDALRTHPPGEIPVGLVAQEGGVPKSAYEGIKDTRIQIRGEYARLGAVVPRRFPTILTGDVSPPKMSGSGRLELARWLVRSDHPLTARVMANRIWEFHFGEGLVRTPSNYGKLGEPPSNPGLLDTLARTFVESGWSIKAMHRLIMNSASYQQSSIGSSTTYKADPENRLFGRMNRRRLESELVRDSLLAVSGRLDTAMGGPSYRDFNLPRRTLYFMTIRSDRSSFGPLFDAADATAIVDKRVVSTVAPQALFLLNSDFVLNAARSFAERVLREAGTTDVRIGLAYQLAFGRPPSPEEQTIGRDFVGKNTEDPSIWSAYLQVLLCGNEFLFID